MLAMKNFLPFYIGLRYSWAKRRNTFISFVSLFAFIGMALGVFALIVVLSVMNGFDRELKERILRVVPHGIVKSETVLEDWQALADSLKGAEGLIGVAPFVSGHGLVTYDGSIHGVQLEGIDPETEKTVSAVHDFMLVGSTDLLEPGSYRVALGSLLARFLGVSIGDKINVTLPQVSITPAGVFPRSKRFTVAAVFEVGAQVDQSLVLLHIQDAQKLFRKPNGVDGLRLHFSDIYQAPSFVDAIRSKLDSDFHVQDWSKTQGSLFQAVKMEKTVIGTMLGIIVLVAAFNIITSLVMMITEKRSDIAVLRTMGLSAGGIVTVFMVQGTVIGLVGVTIGAVVGIPVALNLPEMVAWLEQAVGLQVFDPTVYFVTTMPSHLMFSDVVMVCVGALCVSFLATCFPAFKAAQIPPAEALRYDC